MRPLKSGYKTQRLIRDALYLAESKLNLPSLNFKTITKLLNNDRNKVSRNLKWMVQDDLVEKTKVGRETHYSLKRYTFIGNEAKDVIKHLKKQPKFDETEEGREFLKRFPKTYKDYDDVEEMYRDWQKYQVEIEALNKSSDTSKFTIAELIAWAKTHKEIKRMDETKNWFHGIRPKQVEPRSKRPSPFKPKYE